jgi:hypothetical protein
MSERPVHEKTEAQSTDPAKEYEILCGDRRALAGMYFQGIVIVWILLGLAFQVLLDPKYGWSRLFAGGLAGLLVIASHVIQRRALQAVRTMQERMAFLSRENLKFAPFVDAAPAFVFMGRALWLGTAGWLGGFVQAVWQNGANAGLW